MLKKKIFLHICAFVAGWSFYSGFCPGSQRVEANQIILQKGTCASVKKMTLKELTDKAHLIFVGTVTDTETKWDEGKKRIYTYVTFLVEKIVKGELEELKITIRLLGGEIEGVGMWVEEVPKFEQKEKDLLFVYSEEKKYSPIIGIFQGRFRIEENEAGEEYVLDNFGNSVVDITEQGEIITVPAKETRQKMVLASFLRYVDRFFKN